MSCPNQPAYPNQSVANKTGKLCESGISCLSANPSKPPFQVACSLLGEHHPKHDQKVLLQLVHLGHFRLLRLPGIAP